MSSEAEYRGNYADDSRLRSFADDENDDAQAGAGARAGAGPRGGPPLLGHGLPLSEQRALHYAASERDDDEQSLVSSDARSQASRAPSASRASQASRTDSHAARLTHRATDFHPRYGNRKTGLWLMPDEFMHPITVAGQQRLFFTAERQLVINIPMWKLAPAAKMLADLRQQSTTLGKEAGSEDERATIDSLGQLMAMLSMHPDGSVRNGSHIERPDVSESGPGDGDAAPNSHAPDCRGRGRGQGRRRAKGSTDDNGPFRYVFDPDHHNNGGVTKRALHMRVNMIEHIQGTDPSDGSDCTVAIRLWVCVLDPKFSDVAGFARLMDASAKARIHNSGRGRSAPAATPVDDESKIGANLCNYCGQINDQSQLRNAYASYGLERTVDGTTAQEAAVSLWQLMDKHPLAPEQMLDPAINENALNAGLVNQKGEKLAIWAPQALINSYLPNRGDNTTVPGSAVNTLVSDDDEIDLRTRTDVLCFSPEICKKNLVMMLEPTATSDVLRAELPPGPTAATRPPNSAMRIFKHLNDGRAGLAGYNPRSVIVERCFVKYMRGQPYHATTCNASASKLRAHNREMGIFADEPTRKSTEQPHKVLFREHGMYHAMITTWREDKLAVLRRRRDKRIQTATNPEARAKAVADYYVAHSAFVHEHATAMNDYYRFAMGRTRELLLTHDTQLPAGWVHAAKKACEFLQRPDAAEVRVSKMGYTAVATLSPFGQLIQRSGTYARTALRFANELAVWHHQATSALEALIASPKLVVMYFGGYASGKSHNIQLLSTALFPDMLQTCGSSSALSNCTGINNVDGYVCTWDEMPAHAKEGSQEQDLWKELVTHGKVNHKRAEEYFDARSQKRWRTNFITTFHNEKMMIVSNAAWFCGATASGVSGTHKAWMSRNVFVFCRRPVAFPEESYEALLTSKHGHSQDLAQKKMQALFALTAFCCNCIPAFGPDLGYAKNEWARLDAALHEEQDVPALVEIREKQNREMLFVVTAIQHAIHVRFFDGYATQFANGADINAPFCVDDFQPLISLAPLLAAPTPEVVAWVWQLHAYTRPCVAPVFDAVSWSLIEHFGLNATSATDELPLPDKGGVPPSAAPLRSSIQQESFHPLPFWDTQTATGKRNGAIEDEVRRLETISRRKLEVELKNGRGEPLTSAEKNLLVPSIGSILLYYPAEEIKRVALSVAAPATADGKPTLAERGTSRFEGGGIGRNGVITRFPSHAGADGRYATGHDFSRLQSAIGQSYAAAGESLAKAPYLSGLGIPPYVVSEALRLMNATQVVKYRQSYADDTLAARQGTRASSTVDSAAVGLHALRAANGGDVDTDGTGNTGDARTLPSAKQLRTGALRDSLLGSNPTYVKRLVDYAAQNGGYPAATSVFDENASMVSAPPVKIVRDNTGGRPFVGRAAAATSPADAKQEKFVLEMPTAYLMRTFQKVSIATLYNKTTPGIGSIRELDMPEARKRGDGTPYEYTLPATWEGVFFYSVSSAIRSVVWHECDAPEFVSVVGAPGNSFHMLTIPMNRADPKQDVRVTSNHAERLRKEMEAEDQRARECAVSNAESQAKAMRIEQHRLQKKRQWDQAGKVPKFGPSGAAIALGHSVRPAELAAINAGSGEGGAYQDNGGTKDPWPDAVYRILDQRGLLGKQSFNEKGNSLWGTFNNLLDLRLCRTRRRLAEESNTAANTDLHAEGAAEELDAEAAAVASSFVNGHHKNDIMENIARAGTPQDEILDLYRANNCIQQSDSEAGDDDDESDDNDNNDESDDNDDDDDDVGGRDDEADYGCSDDDDDDDDGRRRL